MAVLATAMSLHGAPAAEGKTMDDSPRDRRAIVVHLNSDVVRELQQCSQHGKVLQLLGGTIPRIRYGTKMLDLNVKPETFRHEIYSANQAATGGAAFAALVSHQARLKTAEPKKEKDSAGADAALATLKQSLASMAKEKEARKATISVNQTAKNGKAHAHRPSASLLNRPHATSTPRQDAPTSAPQLDAQVKAQEKGMRIALVHLLAVRPTSEQDIASQTRIPKSQLPLLLSKVADKSGSGWELSPKSYKELNPWVFKYRSEAQRQAAIDNAVRAFDRTRIAKDDKLWQLLLPKDERGKGKVLSRLHLGVERRDQLGTPGLAPSPIHDTTEKLASVAGTPKVGPASTPRNGASATGRSAAGISIEKRLKDAKKKQDQEKKKQDQEKKKRETQSAASDRETKPRETKPRPTMNKKVPAKKISDKVKSDEVVHDSDDEEGEIVESRPAKKSDTPINDSHKMSIKSKPAPDKRLTDSIHSAKPSSQAINLAPDDVTGLRSVKREKAQEGPGTVKKSASSSTPIPASKSKPTAASTQTASQRPAAKHSALNASSSSQRPVSPTKTTRPKVPSPLGTTKPRNASEEAERVPKHNLPPKPSKPSTPAVTATKASQQPKGSAKSDKVTFYGETTGRPGPVIKKRPLDHGDESGEPPRKVNKVSNSGGTAKLGVPGASKSGASSKPSARPANDSSVRQKTYAATPERASGNSLKNTDGELKRKANDMSSGIHDHEAGAASKHRKTNSSSTHSLDPTNSSLTSLTTAPTASPDPSSPRSLQQPSPSAGSSNDVIQMFLNDAEASPKTQSTWETALDKAAKFRTQLYPAYLELYDRLESMAPEDVAEEDRRTLFMMHSKLKAFKKDIYDAVG